ncbi:2Fe-2S iron-sulfur cluster binding domain-containing protein [Starkeya sp. ORNL1]|uniref:xanthine dehydrogenase family Fe-S subunit n=1 Tax=Starkeya sp. ORNL1 TaxID=2709380 RepID=UPI0014645E64|nr:2Fe-2S iron-sulfur cluster-binding protein [Starkeya sp. ORNL1]QJP13392.1 2Fe-2S iron-sulfur cluster binding domain-containing protein [Starkeya sp. ORNL1]
MKPVRLEVNGRPIAADIEPRQHLADFVREEMLLTGTHLGCEHGVCGACTVLIDGAPARSCIAFPVALDGASITTIEGLADDPVTARLREAFSVEHGLQCGFCTPGMLIMARDIVLRRPGACADDIRHELAGNLCRCTGYVGIIRAVQQVAAERIGEAAVMTRGTTVPAPAYVSPLALPIAPSSVAKAPEPAWPAASPQETAVSLEPLRNPVELVEQFRVPADAATVWAFFQQPDKVIACLPGARLVAPSDGRSLEAEMLVKLGPMQAAFRGAALLAADPATRTGTINGQGVDTKGASRVRAMLTYRLDAVEGGTATDVHVDVAYELKGPLAQMSRGTIARDLAGRITRSFAENLAAALSGAALPEQARSLDAGSLAWSMLKGWMARLFGRR